jgi:hypothetical protein
MWKRGRKERRKTMLAAQKAVTERNSYPGKMSEVFPGPTIINSSFSARSLSCTTTGKEKVTDRSEYQRKWGRKKGGNRKNPRT